MEVRKFVKEYQPIEIKEHFKPDVLGFNEPNDFNRYCREYEDEFKDLNIYKLNVKYKIPGYKISMKGKKRSDTQELILIKDYSLHHNDQHILSSDEITRILQQIEEHNRRIASIENYLSSDS